MTCTAPDTSVWHTAIVTVACTAGDPGGSGLLLAGNASFNLSTTLPGDARFTPSRVVVDVVGNRTTVGPFGPYMIDATSPTVSCSPRNLLEIYTSDVVIPCIAIDGVSGLANSGDASFNLSTTGEGPALLTGSRSVCDNAGLCTGVGPFGPYSQTVFASPDGTTTGFVIDPGDMRLVYGDLLRIDRVQLITSTRPARKRSTARYRLCRGSARYSTDSDTTVNVRCGSVTLDVIDGSIDVTLIGADGSEATTSLSAGNGLSFEPTTFIITVPDTNTAPVVVLVDGKELSLKPGESAIVDGTPPTITAPPDLVVDATGPLTVVSLGAPTVSDNVDSSPAVTNDAPAAFPGGTTTVTWTATDASGNSATATQTVTVLTPRDLEQGALDELGALQGSLNEEGNKKLGEGLAYLAESLLGEPGDDEALWVDDFHLSTRACSR